MVLGAFFAGTAALPVVKLILRQDVGLLVLRLACRVLGAGDAGLRAALDFAVGRRRRLGGHLGLGSVDLTERVPRLSLLVLICP